MRDPMQSSTEGAPSQGRSQHTFIPEAKTKAREVSAVHVPSLEVPKGGGAIRGIGETFSSNAAMGTGGMSVPIAVSPGRGGSAPQLAVGYSSGSGNGLFGLGWSMAVPSVRRRTDKQLPTYDDANDRDTFMVGDEEELVPALRYVPASAVMEAHWEPDTFVDTVNHERRERFRPRVEGAFSRIERVTRTDVTSATPFWRVTSRDNVVSEYGRSNDARVFDPSAPSHVFQWMLERQYDDKGNVVVYTYARENGDNVAHTALHERHRGDASYAALHPKRVWYGNRAMYAPTRSDATPPALTASDFLFEVVFDYGDHPGDAPTPAPTASWPARQDAFSSYRPGFELRTQRLCLRVLMFHRVDDAETAVLVKSTDFSYAPDATATLLTAVTHRAYVPSASGYTPDSMPPVEFDYSAATLNDTVRDVEVGALENAPEGLDGDRYRWVDLDMEGLAGLLTEQGGQWYYKRNLGEAKLGALEPLPTLPAGASFHASSQALTDLGGDGGLQLVFHGEGLQGFFERTQDGSWEPFQTFVRSLNVDLGDPNVRMLDLDGDGRPEVVMTSDAVFTWYPSKGRDGYDDARTEPQFGDEDRGPKLVFADRKQSIFLADMSGDGLTDLVRIENGGVCYWPNLGHGRFGAKVSMTDAPVFDSEDMFRTDRIRLADIDGTGTTDLIYLGAYGRHGARLWRNRAGNRFRAPEVIASVPALDPLTHVTVVDLLGQGTACVVWSSSHPSDAPSTMRYVDLLGGVKPYLMTKMRNNLGSETELRYESSTKHYLRDRAAGTPWVTRLSFPVQVVAQVVTRDLVTGSSHTVSYRYHHGYFDRVEREFRGFGMVEQTDAEHFEPEVGAGLFGEDDTVLLAVPPVITKTWTHTGAYLDGKRIEARFRREYWRGDTLANDHQRLPITVIPEGHTPTGLWFTASPVGYTPTEQRLMVRALRGRTLHTEVFANEGGADSANPYAVTDANFAMDVVQPARGRHPAVVMVLPGESVSWQYERDVVDPRVTHSIPLTVDKYGTVLAAATVGYPRRSEAVLPTLSTDEAVAIRSAQAKMTVTVATTEVTHVDTDNSMLRLAVPNRSSTYEVTGLAAPSFTGLSVLTNQPPDRVALLAKSALTPVLALAGTTDDLAYHETPTSGHLQRRLLERTEHTYYNDALSGALTLGAVGTRAIPYETRMAAFTPAMLDAVFTSSELLSTIPASDGTPTGHTWMEDGGYALADGIWWARSGRMTFDASHFYLPTAAHDPFGNVATVEYDETHHLFATKTTDPVGNVVEAAYDTRLLAPHTITDPNGNRTHVRFDTLGRVVDVYVIGKIGQTVGDVLPTAVGEGVWGQRIEYSQKSWMESGVPVHARVRVREIAGDPEARCQESVVYSDGFGRELVTKMRCESESGSTAARWIGTGRTVYNNKGKPVKKYEPYFCASGDYDPEGEDLHDHGVTPVIHYDPLGRVVRTDLPDGTFTHVEFDAWCETNWDANDNVEDSAWAAARSALAESDPGRVALGKAHTHRNTPTITHADALGRPVAMVALPTSATDATRYVTRVELDVQGQQRKVVDALGRLVQWSGFDMLGRALWTRAMDAAGTQPAADVADAALHGLLTDATSPMKVSRSIGDTLGKPLVKWTERGARFVDEYDAARRLTKVTVTTPTESGTESNVTEYLLYGEVAPSAATHNLRGRVWRVYDGAGLAESAAHDYRGQLIESSRRLRKAHKGTVDWSAVASASSSTARETAENDVLLDERFVTQTSFDALGRPVEHTPPRSSDTSRATTHACAVRYGYNVGGLLERVEVKLGADEDSFSVYVDAITYNARRQRASITYGNGFSTAHTYDPQTFRLSRMLTTKAVSGGTRVAQDLSYTYDPVGNITQIDDDAANAAQRWDDDPSTFSAETATATYKYDAIYRLILATGREHPAATLGSGEGDLLPDHGRFAHANDLTGLRGYEEEYLYDAVGNFREIIHRVPSDTTQSWTRLYSYEGGCNRLKRTSQPGDTDDREDFGTLASVYPCDEHGNMLAMPHLPTMAWNAYEELVRTKNAGGDGRIEHHFQYDAQGQRVRKVVEHYSEGACTLVEERIYLGGYEVYRKHAGDGVEDTVTREVQSLQVMDGEQRIAMVDTRTVKQDTTDSAPVMLDVADRVTRVRYQSGNHLGTAAIEVDENGGLVSYEEFHPYGTSAMLYQRGSDGDEPKRYRFTGMECDETGLQYHSARYYSPWLGRWVSADPSGLVDGGNGYSYCRGSPINRLDRVGRQTREELPGGVVSDASVDSDEAGQSAQASIASPENSRHPPAAVTSRQHSSHHRGSSEIPSRAGLQSPTAQFLGGVAAGGIAGWLPFGALLPERLPGTAMPSREFRLGRALSESAMGGAQLIIGVCGMFGGGGAAGGGLVLAVPSGGSSLAFTAAGGSLAGASAVLAGQGLSNIFAGTRDGYTAMTSGDEDNPPEPPIVQVNPSRLRYTQRTAGGEGRADELRQSMGERGYDPSEPIDVVQTLQGYTTVDNTRPAVAHELGIESIPARVHAPSDPLPPGDARRFGGASTWGEAAAYRASTQRPPLPRTGSPNLPRLPRRGSE